MHARTFEQWITQLSSLTRRQRERLLDLLLPAAKLDQVIGVIEQTGAPRLRCAHCDSRDFYRHGHAHGLQRYRCKRCGRTCNALSGTALARLRYKGRWLDYLGSMLDSRSIRRSAAEHGVAGATSFRWRHRFLSVSKDDRAQRLSGIAEADEMYLLESQKGARKLERPPRKRGGKATKRGISNEQMCILVARDRTGQTLDWVPGKGTLTPAQLHQHLLPRLAHDALLVSDGHPAYRAFARQTGVTHQAVNLRAGIRVRGAIHVQNVNSYHSRLRGWLLPFRGVASRYLSNYLGWRWALDGGRIGTAEGLLRAALGTRPTAGFNT